VHERPWSVKKSADSVPASASCAWLESPVKEERREATTERSATESGDLVKIRVKGVDHLATSA
jgi:hypothetical protein